MRITENMRVSSAVATQQRMAERVQRATEVASSGARVGKASDDPSAWATGQTHAGRSAAAKARGKVLERAASDLEVAEGALASAVDVMARARAIATQMANGSMDAATRKNAAIEVDALRDQLLGLANTQGAAGYVFGGTKTDVPPFTPGYAFVGNTGTRAAEIAPGTTLVTNLSGARAFTTAGGRDPFADLGALATALRTNAVAGITAAIDASEAGRRQLSDVRSDAGLTLERARSASEVLGNLALRLDKARAGELEADAAPAFTELKNASDAYDRSLTVTKQILSLSSLAR
ncbi:MAG: hypothetical protein JNL79_08160 [Myxococcales bacterium]|nr:hypothetical protein [Myxococcales bacterium]